MKRMDNRVASFAETQEGSATEWESEAEEAVAPITGMRPAGMSDENWDEEDLDLGYHPTSEIADKPPEMDDEQIEGARSAPPPDAHPQESTDVRTETTDEAARYPPADKIMVAESQYGNPGVEDKTQDAEVDNTDNDYNAVVEETYYERGEEELDYDDDMPVEEDTPAQIDDQELDEDVNADDEEEDDHATAESVHPKKGKDAPVWGQLVLPLAIEVPQAQKLARPPN